MKHGIFSGAGLLVIAMIAATWSFVARPSPGESRPPREIVLDARGVAFNATNPTLELRPGETVRIVVRNRDPGVLHSITIPGLHDLVVHVPSGQERSFVVQVPESGRFDYVCPQHAPRMQGDVVVQP